MVTIPALGVRARESQQHSLRCGWRDLTQRIRGDSAQVGTTAPSTDLGAWLKDTHTGSTEEAQLPSPPQSSQCRHRAVLGAPAHAPSDTMSHVLTLGRAGSAFIFACRAAPHLWVSYPWSTTPRNIKWKIPDINNSQVSKCTLFSAA